MHSSAPGLGFKLPRVAGISLRPRARAAALRLNSFLCGYKDARTQRRKGPFRCSLVERSGKKTDPAESQIARRRAEVLNLAVETGVMQFPHNCFPVVQTIKGRKNLTRSAPRSKPVNIELMKPVGSQPGRQHRVVVPARGQKQQSSAGPEYSVDLSIASFRKLKMLRNESMKYQVE